MNQKRPRERIADLEAQVGQLVNYIFAIGEILEDKNIATKAEIMTRVKNINDQRMSGIDHDTREKHRHVLEKIYIPPKNGPSLTPRRS